MNSEKFPDFKNAQPEVMLNPDGTEVPEEPVKKALFEAAQRKAQIGHNVPFNIGKATICQTLVFEDFEQGMINLKSYKGGAFKDDPDRLVQIQHVEPMDEYFEEGIKTDYFIGQTDAGLTLEKHTYLFDDNEPQNNHAIYDDELGEYEKSLGLHSVSDMEARHLKVLIESSELFGEK